MIDRPTADDLVSGYLEKRRERSGDTYELASTEELDIGWVYYFKPRVTPQENSADEQPRVRRNLSLVVDKEKGGVYVLGSPGLNGFLRHFRDPTPHHLVLCVYDLAEHEMRAADDDDER
jgi:hypothetical protein